MVLDTELLQQIKKKKTEEVEAAWKAKVAENTRNLAWFFAVASELRNAKLLGPMTDLLVELVDTLGAADAWEAAFDVLREGIALAPRNRELRDKALECIRTRYDGRQDLDEVMVYFKLDEADDTLRAFEEMRDWLRFGTGEGFWLFGRGLGKVDATNLALQKVELRFEKAKPLVVRRDEARKLLTWIPPEHFMLRRLADADAVKKEAKADPGEFVRALIQCFGRSLNASEVKECMTGVIEGGAWTSWWAKARAHPQVLPDRRVKGAFSWSDSSEEAVDEILGEFRTAALPRRMEIARKFGKRGGDVKEGVIAGLMEDLQEEAPSGSAVAVELSFLIEELGGKLDPNPLSLEEVLTASDAATTLTEVGERRYREKLYKRLPKAREDWPLVLHEAFFQETDLRLMNALYETLHTKGPDGASARVVAEASSNPRKSPWAFIWVAKNALRREEMAPRANHALLQKVVEALDSEEYRDLKAHLREHFDEGGLAFEVFEKCDLDGADQLLTMIDSAALEEHRKTAIRRAIFRRYPRIRKASETAEEVLWATAEAVEQKRQEFDSIVRLELPECTEQIRVAREFGDLSENFEYHAARQKHELLSTRAARLQKELRKSRLIDPRHVDSSVVTIGTTVKLVPLEGGPATSMTILGPWDSDPDSGVYSNQSDFAKALLGNEIGEAVHLDDTEYKITGIKVWREAEEGSATARS